MNREKIKQALDLFENDKYVECKEILVNEIKSYKNEYLIESLGLQQSKNSLDDDTDIDDDTDADTDDE